MIDKQEVVDMIKTGKAKPVARLSQRKTVYRMEVEGETQYFTYSEGATVDLHPNFSEFRVGDFVNWKVSSGREYVGKIVAEVPPGQRIESILYKFNKYNVRPVTGLSPRGQISYLVSVKSGDTFTLYWPPVSRLRKVRKSKSR